MAGIYIHIPFCKQACYYCNFHFSVSKKLKSEMLKAIENEILLRKNEFIYKKIETIYFGGGTPSVLNIDEIKSFLNIIYANFNIEEDAEITFEANPDDLKLPFIKQLKNVGVNRLSIGVQSFYDDDLLFMNRAHNANEAKVCIENSLKFFDNITIDLIYGIPKMSNEEWKKNIETAINLGVPHISSYALTIEPKTVLHHFIKNGKVNPLDEDQALAHFNILIETTEKAGFVHYEISNFGKPNYFSKHNTSYWLGKKYLGFGPSAHSFNGKERSWNLANNPKYIKFLNQNKLPSETEVLTKTDLFNEQIMTGLRTIWGVDLKLVKANFGETIYNNLLKNAEIYIEKNLLKIENNTLLITKEGKFLADGIASNLFKI